MTIAYDPDNMWQLGHHLLPEMEERHRVAHDKIDDNDVHEPTGLFEGELYDGAKTRWMDTVGSFRAKLLVTKIRLNMLGECVETAVLNAVRSDQVNASSFDNGGYWQEVTEAL